MIGLVAVLRIKPGMEEKVKKAAVKMAETVRKEEKDCLLYDPFIAQDNPSELYILEKYTSIKALDEHRKLPHYLEFRESIKNAVTGPPEVTLLDFLG